MGSDFYNSTIFARSAIVSMGLREQRLENFKRLERSEAIERFELSETLERNNLQLPVYQETMDIPTLLKMRAE